MYAYVYGPDWEDIAYFSDFEKAYRRLETHRQFQYGNIKKTESFWPVMISYVEDGHGDLVPQSTWSINDDGTGIVSLTA